MRILSLLVLAMVLFGCGGGVYNGRFSSVSFPPMFPTRINLQSIQSGSSVTGTVTFEPAHPQFTGGSFIGQVNGDSITMSLNLTGSGTGCQVQGTGSYSNQQLNLNFANNGQSCGGGGNGPTQVIFQGPYR